LFFGCRPERGKGKGWRFLAKRRNLLSWGVLWIVVVLGRSPSLNRQEGKKCKGSLLHPPAAHLPEKPSCCRSSQKKANTTLPTWNLAGMALPNQVSSSLRKKASTPFADTEKKGFLFFQKERNRLHNQLARNLPGRLGSAATMREGKKKKKRKRRALVPPGSSPAGKKTSPMMAPDISRKKGEGQSSVSGLDRRGKKKKT